MKFWIHEINEEENFLIIQKLFEKKIWLDIESSFVKESRKLGN